MSATGGTRWRRHTALLLLALATGAAGLAGCEYADDVGLAPAADGPSARSHPPRPTLPAQDPELAITQARNTAELERILGAPPEGVLLGGAGGIGGSGFSNSLNFVDQGTYSVVAACAGAPSASLQISQDVRLGGTQLELNLGCGTLVESTVDLAAGQVWTQIVGNTTESGTGGVAGLRITPASPRQ